MHCRSRLVVAMGTSSSKQFDSLKEVSFILQGKLHTVKSSDVTPETSLNSYLRNHVGLRGTKSMCYEGGCGACIVVATIKHPITKQDRKFAVNSCLIPILLCHGWIIETVEGIGNKQDNYNVVQKTLAKFNGTQCGYCSPGMVMNMYALYETNEKLTMKEVENSFGGSLCRCTGYRPIMDAFKSLTMDVDPCSKELYAEDIEDIKLCKKTGNKCTGTCVPPVIEEKTVMMSLKDDQFWYKVYSIEDILDLFSQIAEKPYRLVGGNTGKGVYPITPKPDVWIDILSVPELVQHSLGTNLILGANVSITDAMSIFNNVADEKPDFAHLKKVYDHLDVVANVPVRNAGTLGGNLAMKHEHHEFPSDIYLLLEVINAKLEIVNTNGSVVSKTLVDYLNFDMNKRFLKSIVIPPLKKDNHLFESYKICPRVQNAHAYVNAGFLIEHDNYVVKSARFVIGGINPNFIHATKTEKYLIGKSIIDNSTIEGALETLNEEINPDYIPPDATPEFRKNLALALFYKFIIASVPSDKVNPKYITGGDRLNRGISSGSQMYDTQENLYPLTQPIPKIEALIQCSGEAQYVNDMPVISGEVFAAFVLAEAKPFSKIKEVDLSKAENVPGYITFLNYKAIPGINSFTSHTMTPVKEQLFAEDKVLYNGQPIGVVIAITQCQALEAAAAVKITFEASEEIPCYTIEDVLKNNQTDRIKNLVNIVPKRKGNNVKQVIKGNIELGSQYHFTMETQSTISIPNDEGGLDIYSSTQWMDHVQSSVSSALNIPMHKINVNVKRLGGAYGAKVVRASMIATACAVAAHKLNKPVRLVMPLIDNMKCVGKRIGASCKYEVGIDDKGTIQYLDNLFYQPSGQSIENEQMTTVIPGHMMNAYISDTWALNGNIVKTDLPGNGYCRSPGSVEAVCMIETIMDHIAYVINKDPVEIRKANIRPDHETMKQMVEEILKWSEYEKRKKEIDDFNSKNRWMKKGISMVLMDFNLEVFGPLNSLVSIYAQDGTVAISHGGIECGQGINTKVAQVCAYILKIPLEMIQVKASNVLNAPNNLFTAGSATSEGICFATMEASKELMKRLEPIREGMKNPTWKELIAEAFKKNVNLSASSMFTVESGVQSYYIPGTCVAEVTCDVLTGEHMIDKVIMIEDVGQSMSPLVDVGQLEGAFVMGLGYYTTEKLVYDNDGKLLSNRTWTYKVPGVKDIPVDFRIKFKQDSSNPQGVLNSKATAEPSFCLSVAIPLAIRYALASARVDAGQNTDNFLPINGPTTVEFKFQNSLNDYKKYTL